MAIRSADPSARRYYRADDGRLIAGVAAGMAEHLGVSVIVVRAALVLLTVAGGAGLLMYAAFWALVPQRETAGVVKRADLGQLGGFLLLGIAGEILATSVGLGVGPATSWPVFVAAAGGALIWRQADVSQRSRWLSSARSSARTSWRPVGETSLAALVRVVAGGTLLLAGLSSFLLTHGALSQMRNAALAALAVIAGTFVVAGPWLIRLGGDLATERRERIRNQERAEIAARVHDSVLHTLALIQRNIDDPREVARLARAQERDLRSWLYRPGTPAPSDRLGAAIEQAAGEVEDSYRVSVDVVVVGDAVLDEALSGLVQAAREAMVNAAKSSGAPTMSVYVEVEGAVVSAFVRDRGKGFDLDGVGVDRYGIKQSIVGRMQRFGGTAQITTAPGEGTEVALTMPVGATGRTT
jgi:signal transduction histidine kinase/phage shock protein PspC (stress-responsive transcriptional regulator)